MRSPVRTNEIAALIASRGHMYSALSAEDAPVLLPFDELA